MILTRLGNKRGISKELYKLFPQHKLRIELFFGAGGSFFNLPKAKYNILNDLDDDVTNLYLVLQSNKQKFIEELQKLPPSESLIKYWKNNPETDSIKKAIRFIFLSNFTYLGKGDTLRLGLDNTKSQILTRIEQTLIELGNTKITNSDFREVISKINFSEKVLKRQQCFCYMDPVYLDTTHFYKVPKWTVNDTEDCFKIMQNEGIPSAMSEFDSEQILDFASDYKMNVIHVKERRNIKNRKNEVLITNYKSSQSQLQFK